MRSVDSQTSNYLNARAGLITRRFVYVFAKDRTTGDIVPGGFWNGPYTVNVDVISGQTGVAETRTYYGSGSLIDVDDINLVSDLTIQTLRIMLTQSNADVNNIMRGYDVRNAPIEVHYGLFDLSTRLLVNKPWPHFVGQINKSPLKRGKASGSGGATVEAVSRSRELTVTNPAKKSDETQKLRSGDRFRQYSNVAGEWSIWWGEKKNDNS